MAWQGITCPGMYFSRITEKKDPIWVMYALNNDMYVVIFQSRLKKDAQAPWFIGLDYDVHGRYLGCVPNIQSLDEAKRMVVDVLEPFDPQVVFDVSAFRRVSTPMYPWLWRKACEQEGERPERVPMTMTQLLQEHDRLFPARVREYRRLIDNDHWRTPDLYLDDFDEDGYPRRRLE